MKTALILYSGGLDTTVCIPLMRERGFDKIITVTVDVGQPQNEVDEACCRARQLGAEHHVIDAKDRFAAEFCFQAVQSNGDYYGYPLSTAIARPLIAQKTAELARMLGGVDALVHGCTGKGNDQFRIEFGLKLFAPELPVIAPIREMNLTRTWELEYAERVGAPVAQSRERIWSVDENLWGRSIEGGELENPSVEPPESIFDWTRSPEAAPDASEVVEIGFEQGVPISLCGVRYQPAMLIVAANQLAGKHGIGRIDIMEERMIGLKVRENYECPGATLLIAAHRALEALVMTHRERAFKEAVDREWAELAYAGLWWDPLMDDLRAFVGSVQRRVTGKVRLRMYKGSLQVIGRESDWALYSESAASFDDAHELDQSLMTGMVHMHGLETRIYAEKRRRLTGHGKGGPR